MVKIIDYIGDALLFIAVLFAAATNDLMGVTISATLLTFFSITKSYDITLLENKIGQFERVSFLEGRNAAEKDFRKMLDIMETDGKMEGKETSND